MSRLALVADHVDEIDFAAVGRLGRLDRLDHAEARSVALAEDDVGAGRDHRVRHPLAAGGVAVGGRSDNGVADVHFRVLGLGALRESGGLGVPRRRLARDHDADRPGASHLGGQTAGEIGAFVAAQRVIRLDAGLAGARTVDDGDRHVGFGADLGSGGIVAARMGDEQVGAVLGKLAQSWPHVAVAEVLGDQHLDALLGASRLRGIDALLVPTEVGSLLGRQNGDGLDFGREACAR